MEIAERSSAELRSKGHCVVVVAEGCGDTLLKSSGEVDGGKLSAIYAVLYM